VFRGHEVHGSILGGGILLELLQGRFKLQWGTNTVAFTRIRAKTKAPKGISLLLKSLTSYKKKLQFFLAMYLVFYVLLKLCMHLSTHRNQLLNFAVQSIFFLLSFSFIFFFTFYLHLGGSPLGRSFLLCYWTSLIPCVLNRPFHNFYIILFPYLSSSFKLFPQIPCKWRRVLNIRPKSTS
jgi:hypothetical protein